MSPSILREKGYRFYFLSNEENRMHVHVTCNDGEAKFWLEPVIEIADSTGLNKTQINLLFNLIKKRENEIRNSWKEHFGS